MLTASHPTQTQMRKSNRCGRGRSDEILNLRLGFAVGH